MKRVLMTHNGLVQTVLVAPAVIAERMWRDQGCSRITGWYPLTCAAGYRRSRGLSCMLTEGAPNVVLIPS